MKKKGETKHNKPLYKSFDCSIMDLADDISFGVHDLEDALALQLISEEEFREFVPKEECESFLENLEERYAHNHQSDSYCTFVKALFGDGRTRKRFIGRMVHHMITHCGIEAVNGFRDPLLNHRAVLDDGSKRFLDALIKGVREKVILTPGVQHLEFKGQQMVVSVFEAFASEPKSFLPRDTLNKYEVSDEPRRVICDHIAGMTDSFLLKTYDRLFSPRMGSVFDRL